MHFDLARLAPSDAYKLLVSTVVPRPIALTTTVDLAGHVNAAPFSFFNAVSSIPPVVVLGISAGDSAGDGWKDTERNIRETGEFVVNLVDEALAERMNICDVPFPTDVSELEMAKLHPVASVEVKPPRIAEAPVSFECKRITGLSLGNPNHITLSADGDAPGCGSGGCDAGVGRRVTRGQPSCAWVVFGRNSEHRKDDRMMPQDLNQTMTLITL